MDLKDKLNLLWKYLILAAVIVFGILLLTRNPRYCHDDRYFKSREYLHPMEMPYGMLDPGKIKVEKKIINGDTTVMVWVDGKKIDNPEEFLKMHEKDDPHMKYTRKFSDMHRSSRMHKDRTRMDDDDDDDDDD